VKGGGAVFHKGKTKRGKTNKKKKVEEKALNYLPARKREKGKKRLFVRKGKS